MHGYAGRAWNLSRDVRCHSSQAHPVQQEGPDISRLEPALQQQWDHAANAHLGNIKFKPHSNIKVWWKCDQCPLGQHHQWETTVDHRTRGNGCPQCSGRKVCKHNSLATKAPLVAAEWDYEENAGTPDSVVAQSNQPIGWRCNTCGYKWSASPNQRISKKTGCLKCGVQAMSKKTKQPKFIDCQDPQGRAWLAEWDHELNARHGNFPHNTSLKSHKQIFWLCNKCPAGQKHSWPAAPNIRTGPNKTGCPLCAGKAACKCNSLQALYPTIAAEWDHGKNADQPSNHTAGSHDMAWWFSPQRGSWQQSIFSRTNSARKKSRARSTRPV